MNKDLFISFFKIGLFTFGGGYSMLPLMEKELVETKKWLNKEELLDFYAVSQSTPGTIAVNTATFIGYKQNGIIGSIFSIFGMIAPSIIVISGLFLFLNTLKENLLFQKIFQGVRVSVAILILYAVYNMKKTISKSYMTLIIAGIAFLLSLLYAQVILIIVFAALMGFLTYRGEEND
ncbi:MAG: chromate transporter [Fusobacteria bacterium]|nr:chromate transporter [Fusobacteriota bacterium]